MKRVIFIMLLLQSCNENKLEVFSRQEINEIISCFGSIPPAKPFTKDMMPIYVIGKKDSIYQAYFNDLDHIYKLRYNKKKSLEDFVYDIANQKDSISFLTPYNDSVIFSNRFALNDTIKKEYEQSGIEKIKNKYCEKVNDSVIKLKDIDLNLSYNKVSTISYYFYLNRYIRIDNDYSPSISFFKIKKI